MLPSEFYLLIRFEAMQVEKNSELVENLVKPGTHLNVNPVLYFFIYFKFSLQNSSNITIFSYSFKVIAKLSPSPNFS